MADAQRVSSSVTQRSHGFTRGTAVRFDGTNWIKATTGTHGVGIVGSVYDASSFEFISMGELENLSGLTPGASYYPTATGALSTTVNGTAVLVAYTATTGFVMSAAVAGAVATTSTSGLTEAQVRVIVNGAIASLTAIYSPIIHLHDERYVRVDVWVVNVDDGSIVIDVDRLVQVTDGP